MIVYLTAAVQLLFYLSAVPLCLVFRLRTQPTVKFGVSVGVFRQCFALKRVMRRRHGGRRPRGRSGAAFALRALRHLRLERLSLRGRVCLGDAAATAMVCGSLRALEASLRCAAPKVRLRLTPDFRDQPCADVQGMICVRAGQIILAVVRGALNTSNRRTAQWISTRLKT